MPMLQIYLATKYFSTGITQPFHVAKFKEFLHLSKHIKSFCTVLKVETLQARKRICQTVVILVETVQFS